MTQRVLVIDDSKNMHALIKARLAGEPVELHFCLSTAQGMMLASQVLPDLILLDVDMPEMDGFELCRRLKAQPATMNIPVVFLTGAGSTEDKIRGLELGAVDYVTKPFEPAELRARVRAALRTKYLLDLLNKKAMIDGLTGLWNRTFFDQTLAAQLSLSRRSGQPLSIVIADLDHFKEINDRCGHLTGDEALRVSITCSFGIADVASIGEKDLIASADAALNRAKHLGRNRFEIALPTPPTMPLAKAS